jgi:tagatose 6-phosphate kinase
MILVVVPNPSLDKTVVIEGFATGKTFRVAQTLALAGGKGFNVARTLHAFGYSPLVLGPGGGYTGELMRERAAREGLRWQMTPIAGETRTCLTVVEPRNGEVTEIYEQGPAIMLADWEQMVEAAEAALPEMQWMVVSGSCPPGTPPDGIRRLVDAASAAGVPTLLDTYGEQLARTLPARPQLVKINQHEAAGLLGRPVEDAKAARQAARELREKGARSALITLGKQGAAGVDDQGEAFGWTAPPVPGIYSIGSGDALFGGLVAGLAQGAGLQEATRAGVATGAANTLRPGAGIFERSDYESLVEEVQPLE